MDKLITESSANFGRSPRSFSILSRMGYLRVKKPEWLKQRPDDKMNLFFDRLSAGRAGFPACKSTAASR